MSALTELLPRDLSHVVRRIPRDVRDLMKSDQPLFLAGGFIRSTISGERVNDIDLFGPSKEVLDKQAMGLALSRKGRKHDTENAYTVLSPGRIPAQMIHRWLYDDPSELVLQFDYTIARACVWFADGRWQSVIDPSFYADLAAKRLVYCSPQREEAAGGSFMRARKFLRAGYFIDAESLGDVLARLFEAVDIERAGNAGLPTAKILTGLLREVDPLTVIDGLDLVDEHEAVNVAAPPGN